ncbi:MAG: hypothetical protein GTO60_16520 [Gammaproteobacteria bacterium]|nr:hypothetical protein [Gammaproteobacteria bacterium]
MSIIKRIVRAWCKRYATWRVIGGTSLPFDDWHVVIISGTHEYGWDIVTIYSELRFWRWIYDEDESRFFHATSPIASGNHIIITYSYKEPTP